MKPASPVLLALTAAALVAGAGGVGWVALRAPAEAEAASDPLPLPPDVPRLAEGPDYERCLGLVRTDPDAARNFAESWEIGGGGEGARHCGALALLAADEPERAAERLEGLARASRASAATRASVFAQAGQAWMMAGETGRAYGAATMGLTLAPDDADLMLDRAVALGTLRRYADAMDDLNRIVVLDPQRAEAWVFRAAANRHLDRVDQAAEDIGRAIALTPDSAEALLERGIIRQLKGDTAGAKADWQRAVSLAPDSPTADLAQQNLALNEAGPQRR
ncbi:tetratricopeptide repeat protein [Belnapia sp. F-4-1]|uniref:tetratricopeptide repeat protein n=1 Tax=Belnapia sp. F-4-1 TaxID=1545443 RepID=UPI0005BC02EB|nr:tetratricopeptide repeat protein [Belnapia sp. F-4-1]